MTREDPIDELLVLCMCTCNLVPRALFPGFGWERAREKHPGDEVGVHEVSFSQGNAKETYSKAIMVIFHLRCAIRYVWIGIKDLSSSKYEKEYYCFIFKILHGKSLHSDWLREMQFSDSTGQKSGTSVQKDVTNQTYSNWSARSVVDIARGLHSNAPGSNPGSCVPKFTQLQYYWGELCMQRVRSGAHPCSELR